MYDQDTNCMCFRTCDLSYAMGQVVVSRNVNEPSAIMDFADSPRDSMGCGYNLMAQW